MKQPNVRALLFGDEILNQLSVTFEIEDIVIIKWVKESGYDPCDGTSRDSILKLSINVFGKIIDIGSCRVLDVMLSENHGEICSLILKINKI